MKSLIIYIISILPEYCLSKIENLFSIAQGKGYSNAKRETNLISDFLKKKNINPKIILDIGAYRGGYTDGLFCYFPLANYYLFEPDVTNYKFLTKKYSNINNVKVFDYAISDKNDFSTFYSYAEGSIQGSLVDQNFDYLNQLNNPNQKLLNRVKCKRIDDFNQFFNLSQIDFVKLDIEGNEMKAFEGMGEYLKKIKVIQFEFGEPSIDSRNFFTDFYFYLLKNNFTIYRLTPSRLQKILSYKTTHEHFRVTNFVALNNDYNLL